MTLAIKRMQNIGWLALVFIIAILLYPLSLNVAAVHSDLVRMDRKIMETKREISFLEAELTTRANIAQLDEWNDLLYGYSPPTADQFLEGERALANLEGGGPDVKPVMVSVMSDVAPSGEIGRPGAAESRTDDEEAPAKAATPPRIASKSVATDKDDGERKSKNAAPSVKTVQPKQANKEPVTRTERLAKIDEKLLSDGTLRDIQKRSKEERKRR